MRSYLFHVLLGVLLLGCSAGEGEDVVFAGSCMSEGVCVDSRISEKHGPPESQVKANCEMGEGTWSKSECDTVGHCGSCEITGEAFGDGSTAYYWNGYNNGDGEILKSFCEDDGGGQSSKWESGPDAPCVN